MSHLRLAVLLLVASIAAGAWAQTPALFEQYVNYPLSQAQSVAIGDLNGDGRDDAAVGCWPGPVYVFYQDANGSLLTPSTGLTEPSNPYGMAVGDLNGDQRPDLVVGSSDNMVYVYYQQSDGTLAVPEYFYAGGWTWSIALGDFNSDGLIDIATTSSSETATAVVMLWRDSSGYYGFERKRLTGQYARCISPIDLNSDGKKDLAFLVDGSVGYFVQNQLGLLDPVQYLPGNWGYSLTTGDVTGDSLDDIVFSNGLEQPYARICVYPQLSTGSFGTLTEYTTYHYPQPLALLDMDGDGKLDVAAAHGNFGEVSINLQTPDAGLSFLKTLTAPDMNSYRYGALAAGDLNGDGIDDLALVDQFNGLSVFLHEAGARDAIAPTCTADVSGIQGQNGWYTSEVNLILNAVDNEGGSGVKASYYTLEGTQWNIYSGPVTVMYEGTSRVGYYAEDQAGNKSETQWVELKIDTQAPVTTVSTTGAGSGDWFISPVQLDATADDGSTGSGIASVYYTVNGTDWLPYTGPVTIETEGATRFGCYAVDVVGNKSQIQWINVNIDTQAPVLTLTASETALWPARGQTVDVVVTTSGVDQTSGLADLRLKVIDEYGLIQPEYDATVGTITVPLIAYRNSNDPDGRTYTLVLTGKDIAGNISSAQTIIRVPAKKNEKGGNGKR